MGKYASRMTAFVGVLVFAGCASIDVQHLDYTGTKADGPPGIRYYMPKPYLMVTLLPPDSGASTGNQSNPVTPQTPPALGPTPPAGAPSGGHQQQTQQQQQQQQPQQQQQTQNTPGQNNSPASSSAPTTDTSFMAGTSQYTIKLVYLPDFRNPATITMSAGLFGTMSAQPTLQDGWMLTGLLGSADNSQIPQMLGTVISAFAGAAKSATTGSTPPKAGAPAPKTVSSPTSVLTNQMLEPGLYAFTTDQWGTINGVCLAQAFGNISYPNQPHPQVCPDARPPMDATAVTAK